MAFTLEYFLTVIVFVTSVAIWGTRGIIMMLMKIVKDPASLVSSPNHSKIPDCATDPSLGVHDNVVVTAPAASEKVSCW